MAPHCISLSLGAIAAQRVQGVGIGTTWAKKGRGDRLLGGFKFSLLKNFYERLLTFPD
ncbi:hypothetical protein [Spirulina sp. CCNP1310]|uniref:hypothetical protein n=1 Tax=Spirulina sp. CCNP1310 TaxID=3110249 RepID=UPI002B1F349A|nr:hypothetical protein [Spirulina sp. CCNP1310]